MRRTLEWRDCVGRRLAHRNCRIYTNRRWGIKVTIHVQELSRRSLPFTRLGSYAAAQARVMAMLRRRL